jgi:phosphoglycolate phosphatase-like HAD superfamily hydrolase
MNPSDSPLARAIFFTMPICFDLDGTLGHFTGGFALLREALGELWGATPSEAELRACRGSTDWEIVDELHRMHRGGGMDEATYARFEARCLARFEATFHPEGRLPVAYAGIVSGVHALSALGHRVWVVSGNTPSTLAFKTRALGIAPHIPLLGSLPGHSRSDLIQRALKDCPGPHLYVGDRPHDRDAAREAGVPFLGIGEAVPGAHPVLSAEAEADHLVEAVMSLIKAPLRNHQ